MTVTREGVLLWVLVAGAAASGAGCRALSDLVSPSGAAASPTLTVRSDESGKPLAGAQVRVGSETRVTGADGTATFDSLPAGASVEIRVDGFRQPRETVVRSDRVFGVWPLKPGFDDAVIDELVYHTKDTAASAWTGELWRLSADTRQVFLVLSPDLRDERAMHEWAAARMSEASGVTYTVVDQAPPSGVVFNVLIDPATPYAILTRVFSVSGVIKNGSISYQQRPAADAATSSALLHELGHTYGFGHTTGPGQMSDTPGGRTGYADFSAVEKLAMSLMKTRRPQTRRPDNDRSASGTTALASVSVF